MSETSTLIVVFIAVAVGVLAVFQARKRSK
jgi:hypothetical protein